MLVKELGFACVLSIALCGIVSAGGPDVDDEPLLPALKPGEDALVANRNAFLSKLLEPLSERVTVVKFGDDLEPKCPVLTSLFFSTRHQLKWLTPDSSLGDSNLFVKERGSDGLSGILFVRNKECRYVVTIKRFEQVEGEEKVVRVEDISPITEGEVYTPPRSASASWFGKAVLAFVGPTKSIDFTGITFFTPKTLTIYLANADKDLKITSESNFLTHTYTVEIKNVQASLRLSIRKELYSNGQWVNAYGN